MAEYMGRLTPQQNQAIAAMPRHEAPTSYFLPYHQLTEAMSRAADEMAVASGRSQQVGANRLALAQHRAARALNEAIDALNEEQAAIPI